MRHFRRMARRSGARPVTQSYKKVLLFINASFGAGFAQEIIAQGKDSLAAGQTTATDANVPTGSILKYFEIQFAAHNIVSTPCYINCTIQQVLPGQTALDPNTVGGSNQRNQVFHQELFSVGKDQNSTHKFKFKVPKGFQRMKEDLKWMMVWRTSASVNREMQVIYKFYR